MLQQSASQVQELTPGLHLDVVVRLHHIGIFGSLDSGGSLLIREVLIGKGRGTKGRPLREIAGCVARTDHSGRTNSA